MTGRRTRLQLSGLVLLVLGLMLCVGGLLALAALAVRLAAGGEVAWIDAIPLTIIALALVPTGLVQVVLSWPATRDRSPGQAVGGGVAGILGTLALVPLSFASAIALPVAVAIVGNTVAIAMVSAEMRDRRAHAAPDPGSRLRAASAILTALGVGAIGGGVVFAFYTVVIWAAPPRLTQPPSDPGLTALTTLLLLAFGVAELVVGRRSSNSRSLEPAIVGGAIAVAAGGAAWLAASRPGPEAIVAIVAGLAVLMVAASDSFVRARRT